MSIQMWGTDLMLSTPTRTQFPVWWPVPLATLALLARPKVSKTLRVTLLPILLRALFPRDGYDEGDVPKRAHSDEEISL